MRNFIFLLPFVLLFSCKNLKDPAPSLSPQEEEIIHKMANSYFKTLPEINWDEYGPTYKSKIILGRHLFYDKKLSKNQSQNCATCHDMNRFGQDNLAVSPGDGGVLGVRNVPTILNASLQYAQFWDAREETVEDQAGGPIFGDVEMGMTDTTELITRLSGDPKYLPLFKNAFPNEDTLISLKNLKKAIGAFERTLITPSPFDAYLKGELDALKHVEKKGIKSFLENGCIPCHSGELLGGNMAQEFAVFGYYWDYTKSKHLDKGIYTHSLNPKDKFFFKVPGLRNVVKTAPYFHDGSVESLEESIKIMSLAELNQVISDQDIQYMIEFFNSLTGELPDYAHEHVPFPFD